MPSNLILCRPLLLLPSILPSIRVFSNQWDLCIRWPKIFFAVVWVMPTKVPCCILNTFHCLLGFYFLTPQHMLLLSPIQIHSTLGLHRLKKTKTPHKTKTHLNHLGYPSKGSFLSPLWFPVPFPGPGDNVESREGTSSWRPPNGWACSPLRAWEREHHRLLKYTLSKVKTFWDWPWVDPVAATGTLLSLVSSWRGQLARVPRPAKEQETLLTSLLFPLSFLSLTLPILPRFSSPPILDAGIWSKGPQPELRIGDWLPPLGRELEFWFWSGLISGRA